MCAMVLLDVYAEKKKYGGPEEERKVEALSLRLRSATILFDQGRNPILAVSELFSKMTISPPPGPSWSGYFRATDDEIEILRAAGYTLPDWRELRIGELALRYPT